MKLELKRIEKMLGKRLDNAKRIIEASPAERLRLLVALRAGVSNARARTELSNSIANAAIESGAWNQALDELAELGKKKKVPAEKWARLGREAARRHAFAVSFDAFEKALASGLRADLVDEARVGVALAAVRTGRNATQAIAAAAEAVGRSLAKIERAIAKDEKAGKRDPHRKLTLAWVLGLRATLEHLQGSKAVEATLAEARKRCGKGFKLYEIAEAAGIE